MIAITGAPRVLHTAAHSGTKPGCGDCVWTLIAACPTSGNNGPHHTTDCIPTTQPNNCRHGTLEHLYLSDAAAAYQPEGTLCLGPGNRVIPVGDDAAADVARYLADVKPPNLVVSTRPRHATLAGLTTYFTAAPPRALRPHPFGGRDVTETIRLAPKQSSWVWGDGDATGWISVAARESHEYVHGGTARGTVTTRWGATYTISYQGMTFGPYDAVGQLTKRQTFALPVDTSSPVLVSHG